MIAQKITVVEPVVKSVTLTMTAADAVKLRNLVSYDITIPEAIGTSIDDRSEWAAFLNKIGRALDNTTEKKQ